MEGKKTKKRLNAKLHTLMDFPLETEEPCSERKQKHKVALKTMHLNMLENPVDLNRTDLFETSEIHKGKSNDILLKENQPSSKKSLDFDGKEHHTVIPEAITPKKTLTEVCSNTNEVKRSANKLSLSARKKKMPGPSSEHVDPSGPQPVKKIQDVSKDSNMPSVVNNLDKRLERLLSAGVKEEKTKCKKKIKKSQKQFLEQTVLLSDSDELSDCSVQSHDSSTSKPQPAKKALPEKPKVEQKPTECRQNVKAEMHKKNSGTEDSSFDDFIFPQPPKKMQTKGKVLPKKGKVVKKKLKAVPEIDFSSSSDEDDVLQKIPKVSKNDHSNTKNNEVGASKKTDLDTTVDMLAARLDNLLKRPAKKGTKKVKKQPGLLESDIKAESENDDIFSEQNHSPLSEEGVLPVVESEEAVTVRNVSLQVSLNSSKHSEMSSESSVSGSAQPENKESVSTEDSSFQMSSTDEISPKPTAKEISLQVSMSQSPSAESNESSTNEQINEQNGSQQQEDSADPIPPILNPKNLLEGDVDLRIISPLKESRQPQFEQRQARTLSASSTDTKDSSLNSLNTPDESVYITPPDAKPSWESTAIGDDLNIKFSDLNLHMSRISSESGHSLPTKSPTKSPSTSRSKSPTRSPSKSASKSPSKFPCNSPRTKLQPVILDEPAPAVYVPESDSDDESAASTRSKGSRKWSGSSKASSVRSPVQESPGSERADISGPTVISDSEDDDDFEKFLSVMKKPEKEEKNEDEAKEESSEGSKSMDSFIVPDSEVESDEDDDSMLHRKVDAEKSDDSIPWEDAEEGSVDESEVDEGEESDGDCIIIEKKTNQADSSGDSDNEVFRTAKKSAKPPRFTFNDSSSDEDFTPPERKEKFFTPTVTLKKDRGIAMDNDGALFKTPMYVPKKKSVISTSTTPSHSPIFPVSRGGMTTFPSSVPAKVRTEAKRLDKRPQSAGGTEGFLKSLSADLPSHHRDHDAVKYVTSFKANRGELTRKLFTLYNDTVFENKMPATMEVVWNNRLNKTAGRCRSKRDRTAPSGRVSKIELSTKVCDSAERIRDTLIHEMCHAAVWLIHGEHGGHGPLWKAFAVKASRIHPELPPISRCHAYDISYKFIYKCTQCSYQFGRHSKSLDMDRKVCGHCRGRFQLLVNSQTSSGSTPRPQRTPSKFALFVKDNYGDVKKQNQGSAHKDIMQILSLKFSQTGLGK